ncbi:MAG: putative lipid II flippase FtsW [Piscirickettsiaceae bacterium]|nr:putative lipid II flippase FtsW [Piscirickettsiaceae bacterium]
MTRSTLTFDRILLFVIMSLLMLGLVMVASASITIADSRMSQPLYYFYRQVIFAIVSLVLASGAVVIRLSFWQRYTPKLLIMGFSLLILVLIPGIGREVNGSSRWLPLGPINFQVAEIMKLFSIVYIADFLQRHHGHLNCSFFKVLAPLLLLSFAALLLLMQSDMGSMVVILLTVLGMLFLGGIRLDVLATLIGVIGSSFVLLIWLEPYRLQRLQSFIDPWADPFGSGFQLTQALIAFGRGGWLGVGLGGSMQKLFYLPEAHTDFLYSILAEELGLVGAISVMILFFLFIWRALVIGRAAEISGQIFAAQVAYGIGIWLGLQAYINMGVNMGVLPTKGLTLPLMSYGGSSLVIVGVAVALLFRIDQETRFSEEVSAIVK